MERNPHARRGALTLDDIKPELQVVVIRGGRFHHERLTIRSMPYRQRYKVDNPHRIGELVEVEALFVKVTSGGAAAGTEISYRGQGASRHVTERHLSDMGLCPRTDGDWSFNYTVPADGYLSGNHE